MKAFSLSALFFAGLAFSATATDLVPRYISTMTEGVVIHRPYFADGAKKYGIKLDRETSLIAADGGALFRFDKFAEATMSLRSSPLPAETGFNPDTFDTYYRAARALLPSGASAVEMAGSEINPFPINDWVSLRVTFVYRVANQTRRQSITFLNLKPTEQVIIQTVAYERDFEEVSARGLNIIRRWHEIVPEEETPYN